MVAVGEGDGEVLLDVLLGVETLGPGRAEPDQWGESIASADQSELSITWPGRRSAGSPRAGSGGHGGSWGPS